MENVLLGDQENITNQSKITSDFKHALVLVKIHLKCQMKSKIAYTHISKRRSRKHFEKEFLDPVDMCAANACLSGHRARYRLSSSFSVETPLRPAPHFRERPQLRIIIRSPGAGGHGGRRSRFPPAPAVRRGGSVGERSRCLPREHEERERGG